MPSSPPNQPESQNNNTSYTSSLVSKPIIPNVVQEEIIGEEFIANLAASGISNTMTSSPNIWTATQTYTISTAGAYPIKITDYTNSYNVVLFDNYGDGYFAGNLQLDSQGIANSSTTLYNSGNIFLQGSYWNGTSGTPYGGELIWIQDSTTPSGHFSFKLNDNGTVTEIAKLNNAGVYIGNGFSTVAGAATIQTVGASPWTYTNSSASNQQIFVQGGTVSAISFNPNGGTGIALGAFTDNIMIMRPGDTLTITYTAAPTVNTIQV